jgi:hypothetical protein
MRALFFLLVFLALTYQTEQIIPARDKREMLADAKVRLFWQILRRNEMADIPEMVYLRGFSTTRGGTT